MCVLVMVHTHSISALVPRPRPCFNHACADAIGQGILLLQPLLQHAGLCWLAPLF